MVFAQAGDNNNAGQVGGNPSPADYFKELPIITRCWFGATMVLTLSVNFGILGSSHVPWDWYSVKQLELWRFLTAFCYAGPFVFNTLIKMYMLLQFSKKYESGIPFNTGAGGGTADYAFCLLLGMIGILGTYPLLASMGIILAPVFCDNLVYYVLYVWSKKYPNSNSSIWGFPVQGIYLPFAYLAMTVLTGSPFEGMLQGMLIGHLYYFAVDVVPQVYGKDFLQTPTFLIDYFGYDEYTPAPMAAPRNGGRGGFGNNGSNVVGGSNNNSSSNNTNGSNSQSRSGHNWGSGGNRLGNN